MFGLIVKLTSAAGRREELVAMLGGGDSRSVTGCLSFIVARDAVDENVLWITEVWESQAAHEASLEVPAVKEGFAESDTLIAGYVRVATTVPVVGSSHPLHGEA